MLVLAFAGLPVTSGVVATRGADLWGRTAAAESPPRLALVLGLAPELNEPLIPGDALGAAVDPIPTLVQPAARALDHSAAVRALSDVTPRTRPRFARRPRPRVATCAAGPLRRARLVS